MNVATKFAALFFIALLLMGAVASPISAEANENAKNSEIHKLKVQAELLQRMISETAAVANMTVDLELKVGEILALNVSAMSVEELRDFVRDAREVLAELKKNLNFTELMDEGNVTTRLAERLRERLEHVFMRLNLSKEEFQEVGERLRHAWSLGHLKKILGDIQVLIGPARALNITEMILDFANKSAERGNATGLERALNSSSKVLDVLERVKEKLEKLNASPTAIAAIEHAMEKISEMREVLESVKEKVRELRESHNATHEVRELVKNRTRKGLEQVEEKLAEYVEELEKLRKAALEKGLNDLAEELSALLSKLRDLSDAIGEGNLTFKQAVGILAEAKKALENAERMLEKASERKELHEVVSEQLRERMTSLEQRRDQLKEKLEKLGERLPENMLHRLEEIRDMIRKISDRLQEADKSLSTGNESTALKILDDAKKTLNMIEKEINSLESHIENEGGRPGGPGKGAGR